MSLRLLTIITLFLPVILSLPAENRYASALLRQLSDATTLRAATDTLRDGHHDHLTYRGKAVRVVVKDGIVNHIGLALFTPGQRGSLPAATVDFVERYMLQAETGVHRAATFARQMTEDGVTFNSGDYRKLTQCMADTSATLTLDNDGDRHYTVSLWKEGATACSLTFPVDCHLLCGADIGELELALAERMRTLSDNAAADTPPYDSDLGEKLFEPEFYMVRGNGFGLDALNDNRYYRHVGDRQYELVFSQAHPEWSLANLFTTNSIANNIMVEVKMVMFDFTTTTVTVPLTSLLQYFKEQGCRTYFGMIDLNESGHVSEILLDNRQYGYCHIMRVTGHRDLLSTKTDTLKARMNCYIPVSKIKTLFEEKTK